MQMAWHYLGAGQAVGPSGATHRTAKELDRCQILGGESNPVSLARSLSLKNSPGFPATFESVNTWQRRLLPERWVVQMR